jgi:co-chaperonin GroES (HSP10)
MTKIKPARNFVLVKVDGDVRKFGSILLPEEKSGVEKVSESSGIVKATPSEYWIDDRRVDCPISVGDRILFRDFLSKNNVVDKDLFLLHHTDILAIIPQDMEVGALSGGGNG